MALSEYDNFEIGREVGPVEIEVDERRVREFVYAVDDFNPWHLYSSPFGNPVAPVPLLTPDDPDFAASQPIGPEDALASRYEVRSLEPVKIGQKVSLLARNAERYVRRRKAYITRDFDVTDAIDRRPLIRSRLTEMLGTAPDSLKDTPAAADGTSAERIEPQSNDLPTAYRAAKDIPAGSPLHGLRKKVNRKQMFVFSARPGWWSSIHTDPELARSFGFPDAIAQGLMSTGYVSQLCTEFFQEAWFLGGWTSLTFLRPVCIGDELRIEGCVTGYSTENSGKTRLHIDVWCQNQRSELTTAGRASAFVGAAE